MIVFLNKQDILQRKIEQGRKIEKYFPEYSNFTPSGREECNTEYEKVRLFMKNKILVSTKSNFDLFECFELLFFIRFLSNFKEILNNNI